MKLCLKSVDLCENAPLERRQFRNAADVVMHCVQCMDCGRYTAYKIRRDGSNPPELDREMAERAAQAHNEYWDRQNEAGLKLIRSQYQNYLNTPEWALIRERVRQRDKICQGCLVAPIDDVHHLTYEHVRQEFAFELVGLCRPCHARLHGKPG